MADREFLLDIEKKKCVLNTHVKQLKLTLFIQAISKIIHQFNKNNRNVLVFIFHSQCEFHNLQYGNAAEEMRWTSLKQLNAWVQTRVFLAFFFWVSDLISIISSPMRCSVVCTQSDP